MTIPASIAWLLLGGGGSSTSHHGIGHKITIRLGVCDHPIGSKRHYLSCKAQPKDTNEKVGIDFLDSHHHFYDTKNNDFQSFLNRFQPEDAYLPSDYDRDVLTPLSHSEALRLKNLRHTGSVHVESMPDDGLSEVQWIESFSEATTVEAIVASCHLADDPEIVRKNLKWLTDASPKVRGIRWILDCVKDEQGKLLRPATHAGNLRHDGIDYLGDPEHSQKFERGFSRLSEFGLSFDLQCAPSQLLKAAELCERHPEIPVVLNHLGKPMQLLGANNGEMMPDEGKLREWRAGMAAMAKLPHVCVQISGLGWALPNWTASARRIDLVKKLCQETVELFGPDRCMIATNWFQDAISADSDGLGDTGPAPDEYLCFLLKWFGGLTLEEQRMLFAGTARRFYKIPVLKAGKPSSISRERKTSSPPPSSTGEESRNNFLMKSIFSSLGVFLSSTRGVAAAETVGKDPDCDSLNCLGVWDGLLADCPHSNIGTLIPGLPGGGAGCTSSQDDTAGIFSEPWDYSESPINKSLEYSDQMRFLRPAIERVTAKRGDKCEILIENNRYLRALIVDGASLEKSIAEFYFTPNDTTVQFRIGSVVTNKVEGKTLLKGSSLRNIERAEMIRKELRYLKLPVLRNRKRSLFFFESDLDQFGPGSASLGPPSEMRSGEISGRLSDNVDPRLKIDTVQQFPFRN